MTPPVVGESAELIWEVTSDRVIALGGGRAVVFATPSMINLMEYTARKLLEKHLEPDEESVGMDVQVEHTAATALGAVVRGVARVTKVDGKIISFDVEAYDAHGKIGGGRHRRAMIQIEKFASRLQQKSPMPDSNIISPVPLTPHTGDKPATDLVDVIIENGVATMILNRPNHLNVMNPAMNDQMQTWLHWFAGHTDTVRAVILSGAGRAFCAGNDIKMIGELTLEQSQAWNIRQIHLFMGFSILPQPIIAAINGACFGGGLVAAAACDIRIGSHNAKFGMPEANWGWPPSFGLPQLVHAVGKSNAIELCLRGHTFSASDAKSLGLISDVVAPAMLMRRARQFAEEIASKSPPAVHATKKLIHHVIPDVNSQVETLTNNLYMDCQRSPDAREGISAFTEKRKPRFNAKS